MTSTDAWLAAFPIRPAAAAVSAVCESWRILAAVRRPSFSLQNQRAAFDTSIEGPRRKSDGPRTWSSGHVGNRGSSQ